jgi:phosphopentomutase
MRCIILCVDGLGIGILPDAENYQNIINPTQDLSINSLRNLQKYGLNYLVTAKSTTDIEASFGRIAIKSSPVSLRTSLWELAGIVNFKNSKDLEDIQKKELEEIGKKINSKIVIMEEAKLKPKDNSIFLYTIDSNTVSIISKEKLSEDKINILTNYLTEKLGINEIILDSDKTLIYSRKAEKPNLFSEMTKFGYSVQTIGNLEKYFEKNDVDKNFICKTDEEIFEKLIDLMENKFDGIIFALFEDYYFKSDKREFILKKFDSYLPIVSDSMKDDDILFITSTTGIKKFSYSRTREYIPLMIKGKFIKENTYIGVRHSASDIAQTIIDIFGIEKLRYGKSFKDSIMEG